MNTPMTAQQAHGAGDDRTVHIPARGAFGPPPPVDTRAPFANFGNAQSWPAATAYPSAAWPTAVPIPRRRKVWPFAAAGVALAATLAAVTVLATRGDDPAAGTSPAAAESASESTAAPISETPEVLVPTSALSGLLLTVPEVASVAGSATVAGAKDFTDKIYEGMGDGSIAEESCVSMLPAQRVAYRGSGYTSSRQQFLTGADPERQINQAVVSFPSAAAATSYVEAAKTKWEQCANRTINMRSTTSESGRDSFWMIGEVHFDAGTLRSSRLQEGAAGWTCQSGLAARNNVVIDFFVCGSGMAPSVVPAFVEKVSTKIDGAH